LVKNYIFSLIKNDLLTKFTMNISVNFFFKFAYSTSYKFVDKGIFEIIGPTGLSKVILLISLNIDKLQTGYIYHYTSIILIGFSLLFFLKKFGIFLNFL